MDLKICPGYENHVLGYLRDDTVTDLEERRDEQRSQMMDYTLPEGMTMEDRIIAGGDGQDLKIRIYTPAGLPEKAPVILDIHGGGFIAGNLDIDNARCIALAEKTPAIVVGVEYRLSNAEVHFPAPLMDCRAAYLWIAEHGEEIGADGSRIGLHGSSVGGNLAEGLALYLRDHNEQMPSLTVLNCATVTPALNETMSFQQLYDYRLGPDNKAEGVESIYLGGYDGHQPSYYAFPSFAFDLGGLGPHFIIAGEYDPLRDAVLDYARRLLNSSVPTEIMLGGRVGHCFTCIPHPYTDVAHDLIAINFRREFGLLDNLKK